MALRIAAAGAGPADKFAFICSPDKFQQTFHYWMGASGKRYPHTIYPLLTCPPLPKTNFILVHRNSDDSHKVLRIGQTINPAASLNLAYLRRSAAQIGANEIHIHLLAESALERDKIEADLKANYLEVPVPEHTTPVDNMSAL